MFLSGGLLAFLPIMWKNSSRAAGVPVGAAGVPVGAAGVRFLLKKRTKKRKHGNV